MLKVFKREYTITQRWEFHIPVYTVFVFYIGSFLPCGRIESWPSGNMTIAAMMFSLPLLTDVLKKRSMRKNWFAYGIACGFVLLYGYNRIHMTNHFLSDVCFGTLITYLIFAAVSCAFLRTADHGNGQD